MMRRPSLHFFILYFFEGAPIGLVWWAIPTIMALNGSAVDVITSLTALAALPWTFKFLIGPVVDRYFLTVRAHAFAIAAFQGAMLLALATLLTTSIDSPLFFWLILLISFSSAVQDVFIDAWAIGVTEENSRGRVNGAMQAGLLTGRWIFGAGLLVALAHFNWQLAIGGLCCLLIGSILYLILAYGKNGHLVHPPLTRISLNHFRFIFSGRFPLLILVAVLSGFAFESLGAVIGPFLVANGYIKEQIGYILSGTLLFMLLGAVFGGRASDKYGTRPIFLISGVILAGIVSTLGFLHLNAPNFFLIGGACAAYFFIGSFTAASYAFYMTYSRGNMEATRFTFLMAMTNLCESLSGFSIGLVVAGSALTYTAGFLNAAVVSLLGLLVLWLGFKKGKSL
jgi:MFS transporter, PAT family, beta-lactamase induction signal transducer AmpG